MSERSSKVIQTTIYSCQECPYCRAELPDDYDFYNPHIDHYCLETSGVDAKAISEDDYDSGFPDWCPLPDRIAAEWLVEALHKMSNMAQFCMGRGVDVKRDEELINEGCRYLREGS